MNIYSVLDSDDDEKPKAQQKKAAAAPAAAPAAPAPAAKVESKGKKPTKPAEFESAPEAASNRGPKTHSRHGAKPHGDAAKNADAAPRKRQFDRHSGTGRGREIDKDGAGKGNWGSEKQEAILAEKARDVPVDGEEETAEAEAAAEPEPVPEPEPTVFTLAEYEAKRQAQREKSEAFGEVALREVTADFSGLKTKKDEEDTFIALGKAKEGSKGKKEQRVKNTVLDVAFTVAPTEVPRESREGGRGGRGEGRGRGGDRPRSGRGGERSGRGGRGGRGGERPAGGSKNGPKVDITDNNAFPSL